jgi:hypothetical protein
VWRGFLLAFFLSAAFTVLWVLLFGNPRISVDGWQYLSSAKALIEGELNQHYFWVRTPGYPAFATLSLGPGGFWALVLAQTLTWAAAWSFLAAEAAAAFRDQVAPRLFWTVQAVAGILMWCYLGGFVMWPLQQSLMVPVTLVITGLAVHDSRLAASRLRGSPPRGRTTARVVPWVTLALVSYLITPLFLVAPLAGLAVSILASWRAGGRTRRALGPGLLALAITVVTVAGVHAAWGVATERAVASPDFNQENLEDPFWEPSYINGIGSRILTRETYYPQEVAVSLTSLLDITQSRGWRGFISNEYRSDERNINYVFGTEPWDSSAPPCLDDTVATVEIITVDPTYVSEFRGDNVCAATPLNAPRFLGFLGWVSWMLLLAAAVLSLIRKPRLLSWAFVAPGGAVVIVYAILGGAIARYGAPAYLPLAIFGASMIAINLRRRS